MVAQSDARPNGDQKVAGSIPAGSGNILSWRLIIKYFLRSFSGFRCFSFWQNNLHKHWLTAWRTKPAQENVWLGKLTAVDMTLLGWADRKTLTQTNKLSTIDSRYLDFAFHA